MASRSGAPPLTCCCLGARQWWFRLLHCTSWCYIILYSTDIVCWIPFTLMQVSNLAGVYICYWSMSHVCCSLLHVSTIGGNFCGLCTLQNLVCTCGACLGELGWWLQQSELWVIGVAYISFTVFNCYLLYLVVGKLTFCNICRYIICT